MITLEPINGLCNRMRAIDATLALAQAIAVPLRIVWTRNDACGAPFSAIFAPLPGVTVVERGLWTNRLMRRLELASGRHARVLREREIGELLAEGYDFTRLAAERTAFLQTHGAFFPQPRPFAAFKPVASLAEEIDRVSSAFRGPTVGVHVRRTDNVRGIERSPTEGFLERMEREVATNRDARFFLATDCAAEEARILAAFPGRVVTRPKTRERGSTRGIRDAAVDLYCLSRTRRVIGSYFSSFSETAARIGGVPLEIVDRGPPA